MRQTFRQAFQLVIFSAVFAVISAAGTIGAIKPPPPKGQVYMEDLARWDEILWIDSRARIRFDAGHIPGAILLNDENFHEALEEIHRRWNPETPIVVYCDGSGCMLSKQIAARLINEAGLSNVHVLAGGWPAWQASQER